MLSSKRSFCSRYLEEKFKEARVENAEQACSLLTQKLISFRTIIALSSPSGKAHTVEGRCDGTILTDELIDEMTNPLLESSNYGLGISVGDVDGVVTYTHGGGVPGFRSHAGYLPEHDVSYAFSSSLIPLPDGTDVGELEKTLVPLVLNFLG